jgi:2'-5' RNA ligase
MSRFFIALLPPQMIQDYANQIKQYFAEQYTSQGAQKSPPHITLQPPFVWEDAKPGFLTSRSVSVATVSASL